MSAALLLLAAPGARAASIAIDPLLTLLACTQPGCASLDVQVVLELGEIDVDSFGFDLHIDAPGLIGLSPGPLPGNPIPGIHGTVELLADGTTIRGLLNSLPDRFDGIAIVDVATIPLQGVGIGTATFTFLAAEIACSTCNGGAGAIYTVGNSPGELLAEVTVVVPEPGTLGLTALGLVAVGAARRRLRVRARAEGGAR